MNPPTTEGPTAPDMALWDFAVTVYARDGVAPLCLRLQDEHELDVDVVLACLWAGAEGWAMSDDRLDEALVAANSARPLVNRVRELRRTVGSARTEDPGWQATYERLKDAELSAERVELGLIAAAITPPAGPDEGSARALALDGLLRYARRLGADGIDSLLRDVVDRALPVDGSD